MGVSLFYPLTILPFWGFLHYCALMHWSFIKQNKRKSWNIVSLYVATSYNTLLVKLISLKNIFVCVHGVVPSINYLELVCSQTSAATLWTIRAFCDNICLSHRDRVCCDCEWEVTVYLRSLWDWHQSSRVISFVRPNLSSGTSSGTYTVSYN